MIDFEEKIKTCRRRKTIYIVIALFLILLNLFTDIIRLMEGEFNKNAQDKLYGIGYFIGSQFFIIFGLFLFYRVFKINKQIENFKKRQLEMLIDAVGNDYLKE